MLDAAAFDDHDGFAHLGSQRAREMVRVRPRQGGAAAFDLVGFDKESGHGSVHGAAPASRYGGLVAATHLIARTADGTGLSVHVSGEGEPLLLIPGLGAGPRDQPQPGVGHRLVHRPRLCRRRRRPARRVREGAPSPQ